MPEPIAPDDKNWTWVLEARCDDCGFDAPAFAPEHAGAAVRDQARRWHAVLHRGPTVRNRPSPAVWSPLEYGCHVRDVFSKFDERLALMLEAEAAHFENWDQDVTALEDRYDLQDPEAVATELAAAANRLADRFDRVEGVQWSRPGFRSDGSAFTVATMAQYLMHDPVHHLWDVGAEVPHY